MDKDEKRLLQRKRLMENKVYQTYLSTNTQCSNDMGLSKFR